MGWSPCLECRHCSKPPKNNFILAGYLENNPIWVVFNRSTIFENFTSPTESMECELPQDLIFSFWEIWLCKPPYISPIIDDGIRIISEDFWVRFAGFSLFGNSCGLFQSLQVKITGKDKEKDFSFYSERSKNKRQRNWNRKKILPCHSKKIHPLLSLFELLCNHRSHLCHVLCLLQVWLELVVQNNTLLGLSLLSLSRMIFEKSQAFTLWIPPS